MGMMIETIEQLHEEFVIQGGVLEADYDFLATACSDTPDLGRLRRMLRRRQLGEPREYVAGFQMFRGRRFDVDKRVYITDQELTHLVDTVVKRGQQLLESEGRPPVMVEFGVGCGSLSISVKKELPEARVIGLDLDGDAIEVAMKNANHHQVDLLLLESDLFGALPPEIIPDIIFGDPPWGDDSSLYDDERSAAHYHAMPPLSAFPVGGITAVHEAVLADISQRGWKSDILLNLGILDHIHVRKLEALTSNSEIFTVDNASVLLCNMH